ncbi:GNAT family N-acetyltransferase [Paenibacillus sp. P32E]|uniref:GNAT family N-acetyltransferase n=1 Tax=Paenibacillus sp. P32E TaxID=1349434 RepID=UPI00093D67DE|nr:GNAT family N-acetyltransferase [Paenibacillus sp. P32E]OKP82541.1 hypothetical protein A3848_28360 [Paenibacillus sp. P32E]
MKYIRKEFKDRDFLRIRDFLKNSCQHTPFRKNWLIDRWIFNRYWGQIMHDTFHTWPETVGLWEDENDDIVAIVNSEGDRIGRKTGAAFFQLADKEFSNEFLNELVDHAEKKLALQNESGWSIALRVNEDSWQLKEILRNRDYMLLEWREAMSSMNLADEFKAELPDGFRIVDANEINDYQKGFAHGRAFGYYKQDISDDDDAERCFRSLRKAPGYLPELDLAIVDQFDEVASFANVWYDELNQIGILEPVGTIPKYRKMGLGRAVIYEGIDRVKKKGADKMYVGSDQQFYLSIGFLVEYSKEIWQKDFI